MVHHVRVRAMYTRSWGLKTKREPCGMDGSSTRKQRYRTRNTVSTSSPRARRPGPRPRPRPARRLLKMRRSLSLSLGTRTASDRGAGAGRPRVSVASASSADSCASLPPLKHGQHYALDRPYEAYHHQRRKGDAPKPEREPALRSRWSASTLPSVQSTFHSVSTHPRSTHPTFPHTPLNAKTKPFVFPFTRMRRTLAPPTPSQSKPRPRPMGSVTVLAPPPRKACAQSLLTGLWSSYSPSRASSAGEHHSPQISVSVSGACA
ncbi:hypothetical protein B0H19DRAFT_1193875 [Mycena capillaripes]|nr:hypothetical protein B0H19DRAFT_1193875 [Mycena capillaripes]